MGVRLFAYEDGERIVLVLPDKTQVFLSRIDARSLLNELRYLLMTPTQKKLEEFYDRRH